MIIGVHVIQNSHVPVIINVHVIKFVDVTLFYLALVIHSKHALAIGYVLVKDIKLIAHVIISVAVTQYSPAHVITGVAAILF